MKELERTKRISISAVLIIGLLFVGLLGFKMPDNVFSKTKEEVISKVSKMDYLVDNVPIESGTKLIDIRSEFEFNKGHFKGAVNIPTSHLLLEDNIDMIRDQKAEDSMIVLYGATPQEANPAWMLLYQLGIPNVKILNQRVYFANNKFITEDYRVESPKMDYAKVLSSLMKANNGGQLNLKKKGKKKKNLRRKKKKKAEGGC